jgi:hypothetical protein
MLGGNCLNSVVNDDKPWKRELVEKRLCGYGRQSKMYFCNDLCSKASIGMI